MYFKFRKQIREANSIQFKRVHGLFRRHVRIEMRREIQKKCAKTLFESVIFRFALLR